MKGFAYLLGLLFATNTFTRVIGILHGVPALVAVLFVADVIAFAVCLTANWGIAHGREWFSVPKLKLLYFLTIGLGILSVVVRGWGEVFGIPSVGGSILDLGLWFLSYLLFAAPLAVHADRLSKKAPPAGD